MNFKFYRRGVLREGLALGVAAVLAVGACALNAQEQPDTVLPAKGTPGSPALLLSLGSQPLPGEEGVLVVPGTVIEHSGDESLVVRPSEVQSLHKSGFTKDWQVGFGFELPQGHPEGVYAFYALWKQGGEPTACEQTFTVLAGPGADTLTERGVFKLTNTTPWKAQWVSNDKVIVPLAKGDAVVEVRNAGPGDGAKIFSAFLLAP